MSGYADLIPAPVILRQKAKEAKKLKYKNMDNEELLNFYIELGDWSLYHTIFDVRDEILRRMSNI